MHELPVMQKILAIVLQTAEENNIKKILSVELKIGAMSDFAEEWMQKYFNQISKNSIAEKAKLKIEKEIPQMYCSSCDKYYEFNSKVNKLKCDSCNSELAFIGSSDYIVKNIEAI